MGDAVGPAEEGGSGAVYNDKDVVRLETGFRKAPSRDFARAWARGGAVIWPTAALSSLVHSVSRVPSGLVRDSFLVARTAHVVLLKNQCDRVCISASGRSMRTNTVLYEFCAPRDHNSA